MILREERDETSVTSSSRLCQRQEGSPVILITDPGSENPVIATI